MQLHSCIPGKEGGIQVLPGLAPLSQTVGSLLRTPKTSAKIEFGEFTSMEKYFVGFSMKLTHLSPVQY